MIAVLTATKSDTIFLLINFILTMNTNIAKKLHLAECEFMLTFEISTVKV